MREPRRGNQEMKLRVLSTALSPRRTSETISRSSRCNHILQPFLRRPPRISPRFRVSLFSSTSRLNISELRELTDLGDVSAVLTRDSLILRDISLTTRYRALPETFLRKQVDSNGAAIGSSILSARRSECKM